MEWWSNGPTASYVAWYYKTRSFRPYRLSKPPPESYSFVSPVESFEPLAGLFHQLTPAPLNYNMTPPRQISGTSGRVNNARFVASSGALDLLRVQRFKNGSLNSGCNGVDKTSFVKHSITYG
jgi:hypothetical protein